MLSALVISLAAACGFALQIDAPKSYVVGQPFDISWEQFPDEGVDSVTIELNWGENPSQFWAIATVPNKMSASLSPNLMTSAQQLRIPNGTAQAYWGLRANMNTSNDTYQTNYTCTVTQPMVFTSSPLVSTQTVDVGTATAESRTINATVSILADILPRLGQPTLSARFASVSEDGKMLVNTTDLTVTLSQKPNSERRRRLVSKQLLGAVGEPSAVAADGEYTPYTVTVEVPRTMPVGGPYLLVLSLDKARDNGSYVVSLPLTKKDMTFPDPKKMFLAYDGRDLSVGFSLCSDTLDNATLPLNLTFWDMNEDVCMVVETGDLASTPVYVALDTFKDKWAIGCMPRNASSYTKFGWKLQDENDLVNFTSLLQSRVKMYWAPTNETFAEFADDMFAMVSTTVKDFPVVGMNGTNGSTVLDAVRVTVDGKQKGSAGFEFEIEKEYDFQFETSYEAGEQLTVSFSQCDGTTNPPCPTVGTPMMFAYTFQQTKKMTVPAELATKDTFKTYLVVSTLACDGKTMLNTTFDVAKLDPKASSSSSSLSAGEIVGIVCAGVLVCGLAAWWLCMRKSGDDRYTKIDD